MKFILICLFISQLVLAQDWFKLKNIIADDVQNFFDHQFEQPIWMGEVGMVEVRVHSFNNPMISCFEEKQNVDKSLLDCNVKMTVEYHDLPGWINCDVECDLRYSLFKTSLNREPVSHQLCLEKVLSTNCSYQDY